MCPTYDYISSLSAPLSAPRTGRGSKLSLRIICPIRGRGLLSGAARSPLCAASPAIKRNVSPFWTIEHLRTMLLPCPQSGHVPFVMCLWQCTVSSAGTDWVLSVCVVRTVTAKTLCVVFTGLAHDAQHRAAIGTHRASGTPFQPQTAPQLRVRHIHCMGRCTASYK